jgi:hypothetical protein
MTARSQELTWMLPVAYSQPVGVRTIELSTGGGTWSQVRKS